MDDLFNVLSSAARFDKSARSKKRKRDNPTTTSFPSLVQDEVEEDAVEHHNNDQDSEDDLSSTDIQAPSRDRTGKRDTSDEKRRQIHKEQVACFRRSMAIRVANKSDPHLPDPISSFEELDTPSWWRAKGDNDDGTTFRDIWHSMLRNIEHGRWKEPTPIQMQAIPTLMQRRDLIGAAPTGSGKSGAFILPALVLSSCPYHIFYGSDHVKETETGSKKKKKKKKQDKKQAKAKSSREGEIRSLLLAPSRELAAQLHREVDRLGLGKPGGISSLLLSKSNAAHVIAGTAGGKNGLDVLVTTPLRLVDCIEKGLSLESIRLVVLDEADRLLDAADGKQFQAPGESSDDDDNENVQPKPKAKRNKNKSENEPARSSGSNQTQAFLAQMDIILSSIPTLATRALFSATVTEKVRLLAESILRDPVDLKIAAPGSFGGANSDIDQGLMFVGREEGKLLAMRQLYSRGQLKPPVIVFVQSQERAQALFGELLYDGMHVDVIHAGRSRTARDNAVAKFRKGDTWVLICTDLVARGVDFRAVNMVINYDLPASGITYVHRIGRTGRAGRKGRALTLFTEADFDNLRTIANVMKQSGCKVEDWMLQLRKQKRNKSVPRRSDIGTMSLYERRKRQRKKQMIDMSKNKKKQDFAKQTETTDE